GRGPGWAIANEVALKFKEVTQIHAESYSSAEVLHGPVSLVAPGFPVLVLAAEDAAEPGLRETAATLAGKGAACFLTGAVDDDGPVPLRRVRTGHPLTDPLALVVSAYAMVERLATERGIDPDRPRHLAKVTETR
ncbi:MAG: SIS domain-containing protein, partial [Pseudomonadota bacterium]